MIKKKKMKKIVLSTSITGLFVLFLLVACNKTSSTSTPSTADEVALQTTVTQNATDQSDLQNDDDAIASDATAAAELTPGFGLYSIGLIKGNITLGVTDTLYIDSTSLPGIRLDRRAFKQKFPRVVLWYKGWREATGYVKQGKVTIEVVNGKKWTTAGAILKETDSVTVTRGGRTRVYIGTRYVTNVSGGSYGTALPTTFVYTMHAYHTVTFDNGSQRTCWITRKNSYEKQSSTFTIDGDTTINQNLCTIGGKTRFGNDFLVQSPQPIVASLSCGFANPTSGIRMHTSTANNQVVTITFGVDANGTQVISGCAWGYKINWLKLNGMQGTALIQY